MRFCAETELAAVVAAWLESQGWTVGQEVDTEGGGRADIVAERGPKVWAICAKLTFGLEVMEQCWKLQGLAHLVSAAVPHPERLNDSTHIRGDIFAKTGAGVLLVSPDGVLEFRDPRARTARGFSKIQTLPEHRSGEYAAAGTQGGGQYTEANRTKLAVLAYIEEHPRCGINQILADVAYHYGNEKTARHQIQQMLKRTDEVEQFGNASNARYLMRGAA